MTRRRLRRAFRTGFAIEIDARCEFAVGDLAAVRRRDHAVGDRELIARHTEALGGEIEQDRPHLRARHAQRGAAVLDRLAAGGLAFVRRLAGIAGDHLDACEREVEFLGRDLRQRGQDALPELDLAGEDRGAAVRADADPAIKPAVGLQAAGETRRFLPARDTWIEGEGNHDGAEARRELPPVKTGSVHGQVLPFAWAARMTARTMRLWVPQRQRLAASAERTSCSLGLGLRSSNSLADMIMPLIQ